MLVLLIEEDQALQARIAAALIGRGMQVVCMESRAAAEVFLRGGMIDVLIAGERVGGRMTHPLALLAECRNPLVSVVLLSDRTGADADEAFALLPAVEAILGREVDPATVADVVRASLAARAGETAAARQMRLWTRAETAAIPVAPVPLPEAARVKEAAPEPAPPPELRSTAEAAEPGPVEVARATVEDAPVATAPATPAQGTPVAPPVAADRAPAPVTVPRDWLARIVARDAAPRPPAMPPQTAAQMRPPRPALPVLAPLADLPARGPMRRLHLT